MSNTGLEKDDSSLKLIFFYSMCYFLYKTGKNKQSNSSTQGQNENKYGKQPVESSIYPVTVNQSYGKLTPATPSFGEDPQQAMYETVNVRH